MKHREYRKMNIVDVFRSPFSLAPLLLGLALAACDGQAFDHRLTRLSGLTMGTSYSVKITDLPRDIKPAELQTTLNALLWEVNRSMSTYDENSELSHINRARDQSTKAISPELYIVLKEAVKVNALSGGAFDVTVGPLVNLWGFGPELHEDNVPPSADIQQALQHVGMDRIELDGSPDAPVLRKLDPEAYIDLSAIAKGYGVDRLADYLETHKIDNYMVEIGGEIRVKGVNAEGKPWHIAIEKPVPEARDAFKIIMPGELAVATSGDYRNYFEKDGKRYSHTLDPRTGRPIEHTLASVTVLADNCMYADAMATALMVLGPEKSYDLAMAEKLPVMMIVKTASGFEFRVTPMLKPLMTAGQ